MQKKNVAPKCDSDDEERFCLVRVEPFSNSKREIKWIQCTECKQWAHEVCLPENRFYICHNCDSESEWQPTLRTVTIFPLHGLGCHNWRTGFGQHFDVNLLVFIRSVKGSLIPMPDFSRLLIPGNGYIIATETKLWNMKWKLWPPARSPLYGNTQL